MATVLRKWYDLTMARVRSYWLGLLAMAAGCHHSVAPSVPPTSPALDAAPVAMAGTTTAAPTPATTCLDPHIDAVARLGSPVEPRVADFDHDDEADVMMRGAGMYEYPYALYRIHQGCGEFVGTIEAFMIDCAYGKTTSGMCDLSVDTWLMHGDRKRCRWRFVGSAYQDTGDCQDIMGPRKDKIPRTR